MTKPTVLPLWDINETSMVAPGTDRTDDGWKVPAGIPEKPPYQVFNHWQNNVYKWLNYLNEQGITQWDTTITYAIGAYVVATDNNLYSALVSQSGNTPVGDPTNWRLISNAPATQTTPGITYLNKRITTSPGIADPDADITFSGGRFTFSDGTGEAIAPAYTKQLDASFAVGTANGGLDTGSMAGDTTYHCYAVYNSTNGLSDYAFSLSASAPGGAVTAAGYDKSKRVWSIITDSSPNIIQYVQAGNRCYLQTYIAADTYHPVDAATPLDVAVYVPTNITVLALINVYAYNNSVTFNASRYYRIYSSALTSTLPVASATDFDAIAMQYIGGSDTQQTRNNVSMEVLTNNATLKVVSITSADGGYIDFITRGWIDFSLAD